MPEFRVNEQIPHPPEIVWNRLTDFHRAADWMRGVDSFEGAGDLAAGSTLKFRARGNEHISTISRFEPQVCLQLTSKQGPVTAVYTYTLAKSATGTEAQLHAVCTGTGPIRLVMPLLGWLIRRTDGHQLADLKKAIG